MLHAGNHVQGSHPDAAERRALAPLAKWKALLAHHTLLVAAALSTACVPGGGVARQCITPGRESPQVVPQAQAPQAPGAPRVTADSLVASGAITPTSWLPVLGADDLHQISSGDRLLYAAGIASEMFASKGAYSVVAARDFERARALLWADPTSRPYVVTDDQLRAWVERRAKSGLK